MAGFRVEIQGQELDLEPLLVLCKLPQQQGRQVVIEVGKKLYKDGNLPIEALSTLVLASSSLASVCAFLNHTIRSTLPSFSCGLPENRN